MPVDFVCVNQNALKLIHSPLSVYLAHYYYYYIYLLHWKGTYCQGCGGYSMRNDSRAARLFLTSLVTVETCLVYSGLLVVFSFLPLAWSSDNAGACLLPVWDVEQGCRQAWKVNIVGIFLALCWRKMMQNQAKVSSILHCGSHKHGPLVKPKHWLYLLNIFLTSSFSGQHQMWYFQSLVFAWSCYFWLCKIPLITQFATYMC